jgi:hypothetical protein
MIRVVVKEHCSAGGDNNQTSSVIISCTHASTDLQLSATATAALLLLLLPLVHCCSGSAGAWSFPTAASMLHHLACHNNDNYALSLQTASFQCAVQYSQ